MHRPESILDHSRPSISTSLGAWSWACRIGICHNLAGWNCSSFLKEDLAMLWQINSEPPEQWQPYRWGFLSLQGDGDLITKGITHKKPVFQVLMSVSHSSEFWFQRVKQRQSCFWFCLEEWHNKSTQFRSIWNFESLRGCKPGCLPRILWVAFGPAVLYYDKELKTKLSCLLARGCVVKKWSRLICNPGGPAVSRKPLSHLLLPVSFFLSPCLKARRLITSLHLRAMKIKHPKN